MSIFVAVVVVFCFCFAFYFTIAIHSMKSWTVLREIELQEKEGVKYEKHIGKLIKKNSEIKVPLNSRCKAI